MNGMVVGAGGVLPPAGGADLAVRQDELPAMHRSAAPARGTVAFRTVRGLGTDAMTVTPRRVRCADCSVTQILLPTALTVRRADTTEVIGNALALKVNGAGSRTIADRLGRPASTAVCRWLRRVPAAHAQWLYERAVEHAAIVDNELLIRPAVQPTVLGYAINLLAGAALRYRQRFGLTDPPWALIGMITQGRLLAPPLIT